MYVTWGDIFTFVIMLCEVIGLALYICKNKKK